MLQSNPVTTNLIKARELIADRKNWWRGGGRRVKDGGLCAMMALTKTIGSEELTYYSPEYKLLNKAAYLLFQDSTVIATNDIRGHAAVMKTYDKAVELSLTKS